MKAAGSKGDLRPYRRKRDPAATPEPFGASLTTLGAQRFVIQQHSARRMHWDLRLEIGGVLVSWAVPKGPSVDSGEKRLAVQTEDHPLEYAAFEGTIPAGNYGAGTVIVWDQGTYESVGGTAPADALAAGKLDLRLFGHKLRGRWALVRTKRGEGKQKQWLLFKKKDGTPYRGEPVTLQPDSILSGLTVLELAQGVRRDDELARRAAAAGAPRHLLPAKALTPMLAKTAEKPFSRAGWIFELKYDGVRVLATRQSAGKVRLLSRNRRDLTPTFPEIAAAAAHLPCDSFVLDGEIIAIDSSGSGSFERLQRRLGLTDAGSVRRAAIEVPVLMYCFDLLAVGGHDLRPLPVTIRKELLRQLTPAEGVLRFSDHVEEHGADLFEFVRRHHLEGMIAKRAASPYRSGARSPDWLKVKAPRTANLAIVGFQPGKGARRQLGSLLLAWKSGNGLQYAGAVGSGLADEEIGPLAARLRDAEKPGLDFDVPARLARGTVFTEPRLIAEVKFTEVTSRGVLRQPVLLRIREDISVDDCDPSPAEHAAQPPPRQPAPTTEAGRSSDEPRLLLTKLDKVFWPDDGYTKGDLLHHYRTVWPILAPYLRDRPVVLTRYPDGIDGKSFFQRNAPDFVPDWVTTCRVEDTEFFLCNDLDTLLYVVNLGCIPLHIWSARHSMIERPDWTILDLDPKSAPFTDVVRVARHIHAILKPLGIAHFVKTSGQDGLHILIPLGATLTHDQAKTLAEVLARVAATELPDIATIARPLGDRGGKVYIDFLQNGLGKTIASPYSARPRPGGPVSTPLEWPEVTRRLDPLRHNLRTVQRRLARRPDPMQELLGASIDVAVLLGALQERLKTCTEKKGTRKRGQATLSLPEAREPNALSGEK